MNTVDATAPAGPARPWRRTPRVLLWAALVGLLMVAQTLLVALTLEYEDSRAQEQVDSAAGVAAAELKRALLRSVQSVQSLAWTDPDSAQWRYDAMEMLRARSDLWRIERRTPALAITGALDAPGRPTMVDQLPRDELDFEAEIACNAARRTASPMFSRSYFVPLAAGQGLEVVDVCIPLGGPGREQGHVVATFGLAALLEQALTALPSAGYELSLVEGDGTRLARAGTSRGAGAYRAERVVDLPGASLQLRADAVAGRPSLIPNLATALVLGLSIGLALVVALLVRDVRRRARAEAALAQALAFRKAMEDSLVTGLRARDLTGRITYVNPAFCEMVGFGAEELRAAPTPPYWPPERVAEYAARQATWLALPAEGAAARDTAREGHETIFLRKDGERFPVMVYEAPLRGPGGRHEGWMGAVVDLSAQRRVEELSRQQQERLQATARLATVGEMASLLSHELNQPLSAISSYANGSLNLLEAPDAQTPGLLQQALARIAEQAERAGRVIKSVHDFVRRREQAHEALRVDRLFDAVMPLVRLQARKSGTRIEVSLDDPVPHVQADRTMIEQVLLNLTRNGIQAMEGDTPLDRRVLRMAAQRTHPRWVTITVRDAGSGIAPEVAQRLFTPFFTTRAEGMGLGLSLCRTVVEQHGGALDFSSGPQGTEFRFTLPAAGRDGATVLPAATPVADPQTDPEAR